MKSTEYFKETIKVYLDKRAQNDNLFASSYAKEGKNVDDCCTYILNAVQKSGCSGFSDDEIFGMAVHYYDEDNIEIGKPIDCKVVVNHSVELTDDEKADARKKAIEQVIHEQVQQLKSKPKPKKIESVPKYEQLTLF